MYVEAVTAYTSDGTVTSMEYDEIGSLKKTAIAGTAELRYT